jgi:hypothetical protein
MASMYFDRLVGIRKVKRAEAVLLGCRSDDLSNFERSELVEFAWALSTVVAAAQQGLRLAPEVFTLAESVAHSRSETVTERGHQSFPSVTSIAAFTVAGV